MGVPPPGWNKFPTFPKSKIGGLPFDRILDRILRSRLKNDKVSSPKIISVAQPDKILYCSQPGLVFHEIFNVKSSSLAEQVFSFWY